MPNNIVGAITPLTSTPAPPTLASTLAPAAPVAAPRPGIVPKVPASLKQGFTADIKDSGFLHAIIYADTGMWKTVVAVTFDDPAHTLIITTRRPEQLIPVGELDYPYVEVTDADALEYALMYPEAIWAKMREKRPALGELRTLVLDDATEAVELLLEGARDDLESGGRQVQDRRRIYFRGKDALRDLMKIVLRKPLNLIATAVAKVRENPITNEETVGPDLPPSMLGYIGAEFEFVFYIRPSDHKFTTDRDSFTFVGQDENGKDKTVKRSILAKSKLPLSVAKKVPPVIAKYEDANLRLIWAKVQGAVKKGESPATGAASK